MLISVLRALIGGACLAFASAGLAEPQFIGAFTWTETSPDFGGVSGLDVGPDGTAFVAITDRGHLLTGAFSRDAAGAISAIADSRMQPLRSADGREMTLRWTDSEGLAVAADGRIFVSFESEHRVWAYAGAGSAATDLPRHPDFLQLPINSGLEALALGPDGAIYTLAERSGRFDRPFSVWRLAGSDWDVAFTIPRQGAFLPVGADIGPDGRFYLLERDFTGLGFRSRVRRFELSGQGGETLLETAIGRHGNLEGIAVWRDAGGALRLTMVADNNFMQLLSTVIVEYRVDG